MAFLPCRAAVAANNRIEMRGLINQATTSTLREPLDLMYLVATRL